MDDPASPPVVVGIGASAGGIEALEGYFRGLPDALGAAHVVVTHLSPDRESRLHQVLATYTDMAVHVADDGACSPPTRSTCCPPMRSSASRAGG